MSIPYTYLLAWTKHNKYYYGLQHGSKANPKNLWVTYFTSSPAVKKFRKLYGEPDIIEIRKVFDTPYNAQKWETKVLQRLKVLSSSKWLNENIAGAISLEACARGGSAKKGKPFFGNKTLEEIAQFQKKASESRKGKPSNNKVKKCSESAKEKRQKLLGRKKPESQRIALSNLRKGSKRINLPDGSFVWQFVSKSINS